MFAVSYNILIWAVFNRINANISSVSGIIVIVKIGPSLHFLTSMRECRYTVSFDTF